MAEANETTADAPNVAAVNALAADVPATFAAGSTLYSMAEAAKLIGHGCKAWHIRRLFQRHILTEPGRIGGQRVLNAASINLVRQHLFQLGYLHAPTK